MATMELAQTLQWTVIKYVLYKHIDTFSILKGLYF